MSLVLKMAPLFGLVKSESGPIATDSTTYNLTNYPLEKVVVSMGDQIHFYWEGLNVVSQDNLDFKIIVYDATNLRYVPLASVSGLSGNTLTTVDVMGCPFYITVSGVHVTAAANLKVWAAFMLEAPRRTP